MKKQFFAQHPHNLALSALTLLSLTACFNKETKEETVDYAAFPAVKIGVSVSSDLSHVFFDRITNATFKKIAADNPQIQMQFTNSDDDVQLQFDQIKKMVASGVQAMVLHLGNADEYQVSQVVNYLCQHKIPTVYFNVFPGERNLAVCPNAYFVGADNIQIGISQGLAVLEHWRKNPSWDKNQDGVIQYAQIQAMPNWDITEKRTEWPLQTMMNYPEISLPADKVLEDFGLFDSNVAREIGLKWMDSPKFSEVEVVLSNDDDMASGLVEAFKSKGIKLPIFGADGSDWAHQAIKTGDLIHTVDAGLDYEATVAMRLATNLAANYPENNQIPLLFKSRVVLIPPKELQKK